MMQSLLRHLQVALDDDESNQNYTDALSSKPPSPFLDPEMFQGFVYNATADANPDDDYNSSSNNSTDRSRDAYEIAAFSLWYLFLVLCCVVPTCCAYRRRRLVEARLQQQQESVNRLERQNIFILSSLRYNQQGTERVREERYRIITENLKDFTMTVQEENLIDISDNSNITMSCKPCMTVKVVEEQPATTSSIAGNDEDGAVNNKNNTVVSNLAIEYDVEAADPENTHALRIPIAAAAAPVSETLMAVTGNVVAKEGGNEAAAAAAAAAADGKTRLVPAACAICLCPYEKGEDVTWSPRKECQHAFHSDCIIPWLAKTDDPKCPCCRQDYCDPAVIPQMELRNFFDPPGDTRGGTPFVHFHSDVHGNVVLPNFIRNLEASRILSSMEFAASEARNRGGTHATDNEDGETRSNTTGDDEVEMSELEQPSHNRPMEIRAAQHDEPDGTSGERSQPESHVAVAL